VSNRTYEGAPGYWVLTPLVTSDGTGVVVNRGWVPMAIGDPTASSKPTHPPPRSRWSVR
jgi:cytochrome oxidase assembly protein ShyY1